MIGCKLCFSSIWQVWAVQFEVLVKNCFFASTITLYYRRITSCLTYVAVYLTNHVPFHPILYSVSFQQAPVVMRDQEGKMRGATVKEERCMSYADKNLFRRDIRRGTAVREIP